MCFWFTGMLRQFPNDSVRLKVPFSVKPWTTPGDNIGNLLMVCPDLKRLLFLHSEGLLKAFNFLLGLIIL
jgi:hypothetical protein